MSGVSLFSPHLCKACAQPKRKVVCIDAALPHHPSHSIPSNLHEQAVKQVLVMV